MRAQEIFDKAVGALLKQGKKSKAGGACLYRSSHGCCAIGHLIPDELYDEDMDAGGVGVNDLLSQYPRLQDILLPCDLSSRFAEKFLIRLQYVHDMYVVDEWREGFQKVAAEYQLKWNFGEAQ